MYFAEIRSRTKRHHDYKYLLREELECVREPMNRFSGHAIVVKPKKLHLNDNKGKQNKQIKQTEVECDKTVGHVPDSLAEFFSPLMATWKILSVIAIVESNHELLPKEYGYQVEALKYLATINCMVQKCTKRT